MTRYELTAISLAAFTIATICLTMFGCNCVSERELTNRQRWASTNFTILENHHFPRP